MIEFVTKEEAITALEALEIKYGRDFCVEETDDHKFVIEPASFWK